VKGSISAELGRRESSAYGGGEEEHECGEDLNTGARGSGPFDGLEVDWEEIDFPEALRSMSGVGTSGFRNQRNIS